MAGPCPDWPAAIAAECDDVIEEEDALVVPISPAPLAKPTKSSITIIISLFLSFSIYLSIFSILLFQISFDLIDWVRFEHANEFSFIN